MNKDRSSLIRILLWLGVALLLGLLSIAIDAQEPGTLPLAPKPHLDRTERVLLIADASVRGLDTWATSRNFGPGRVDSRECCMPLAIARRPLAMTGWSAGVVMENTLAARWLARRGHPRLARWWIASNIAWDGSLAVRSIIGHKGKLRP